MSYPVKKVIHGNIRRVTGGEGGEALLLIGSEKTALYDTGMAYCADAMLKNLKEALNGRKLDYFLISHVHYDHVGAMPYLLEAYPDVTVCAHAYCEKSFCRPDKLLQFRQLSQAAGRRYAGPDYMLKPYDDSVFRVDRILEDTEVIDLGDASVQVLSTPGHTKDTLAFYIPEWRVLLSSETCGCWNGVDEIEVPFLSGYGDTIRSILRCRELHPKYVYSPHYLELEEEKVPLYFEKALALADEYKKVILDLLNDKSLSEEERADRMKDRYWVGVRQREQPLEAFYANIYPQFKCIQREFTL